MSKESKWKDFLDGFQFICNAFEAYNAGDYWGMKEFWETINAGWYQMEIYPYDGWYHSKISKQRKSIGEK